MGIMKIGEIFSRVVPPVKKSGDRMVAWTFREQGGNLGADVIAATGKKVRKLE